MAKLQVKDAFDLQIGKTPSRKNLDYWTDGTFDWVSIRDLGTYDRYVGSTKERITQLAVEESGIKPVPPNTLIMSFKLSLGKTAITVEPTYTNEAIMAFIDKGTYPVDLGYMFHQLRTKDWTEGTNRAVMGATLNKKSLSESWILLPSEDEQHEAADALDSVIEKLACVRMLQAKLDQLTKSRFVEMFGNPETNPMGWETRSIGELATDVRYGTSKPASADGKYTYVRMNNMTYEGGLDLSDTKRITLDGKELDKALVRYGDLLFNRTNSRDKVGKTCVFKLDEPMVIAGYIIRVRLCDDIEAEYLSTYLNTSHAKRMLKEMAHGAVNQANINAKEMQSIIVTVPPIELQKEFLVFVQQVDKLKLIAQQQIEKLQMLYDSLAQEYFSI